MTVQAVEFAPALPLGVPVDARPRHLRVVGPDERVEVRRLRLTTRGRLVCTLLAFGVLSLAALVLWARLTSPVTPTHSITVESGQTLSQIAVEELPAVPVETAVMRIQVANDLHDTRIIAGQSLVIPGRA